MSDAHQDPRLVFVEGQAAPDLAAFAQRIAEGFRGPPPPHPPGGFGARQRWTLTRLSWTPEPDRPLLLVARGRFIDAADLAAWAQTPPPEAEPLAAGCDGLVDARTPPEGTTFYAVLQGPAPWRSLPLAPLLAPFDGVAHPVLLGDAEGRLRESLHAVLDRAEAGDLPPTDRLLVLELARAAIAVLPERSAVRAILTDRIEALARTSPPVIV